MKLRQQFGFTLVELIVIVAVIGILASVAVVAYRGTQESSKDSAVQSDAMALSQSAKAQYEVTGTYGYGANPPATKAEALGLYNANALDTSTHLVSFDSAADYGDTDKVHVFISSDSLEIGYWSYENDAWMHIVHNNDGISRDQDGSPPGTGS